MSTLRKLRESKKITQKEAAEYLGISLRSYNTYENDKIKESTSKYRFLCHELELFNPIDEEHGILTLDEIKAICNEVFAHYNINYCYLFGSYAKGNAKEDSDVDLLISNTVTGLKFFGLTEELRKALHKKVDLLDTNQLLRNQKLLNELLKDGIRIHQSNL